MARNTFRKVKQDGRILADNCAKSLSRVQLFATLWTVAHQAPLFVGFSRQEYWCEVPCPRPGDLPHPGIELTSPASPALQTDPLLLSHLEASNKQNNFSEKH